MTENPHITWKLGTTRSEVLKRGTDADKSFLPAATQRNQQKGRSNNNRKRKRKEIVLYPHVRDKRQNRNNNINNT